MFIIPLFAVPFYIAALYINYLQSTTCIVISHEVVYVMHRFHATLTPSVSIRCIVNLLAVFTTALTLGAFFTFPVLSIIRHVATLAISKPVCIIDIL